LAKGSLNDRDTRLCARGPPGRERIWRITPDASSGFTARCLAAWVRGSGSPWRSTAGFSWCRSTWTRRSLTSESPAGEKAGACSSTADRPLGSEPEA